MGNITKFSILILLIVGCASILVVNASDYATTLMPENVTTSVSSGTDIISNLSRAALLVDSSQLTNSNVLNNYNRVRATFDYFGYKYDILPYSTDSNTLASYRMIIALSPTTPQLVQNYTTLTGKWALIIGRPAPTLESAYHLTYSSTINAASGSNTGNITTANPMMAVKTVVYYSTYDDYILGSGVTSGATTNDGHKLILTYSGANGSAVILNNGFDQQLVRNFISIADPTAVFVTGAYPYARDLGIVMRYDDLGDDPASGFANYYNVSNDCTIAAVIHNTQPSDVAMVRYADLIPHSYDHIDLSTLSDSDTQFQAQMSMSGGAALFGKQPIGFVPPYNNYTYNTTKILNQTGFRYMLVDSGLTAESNAKDLQYYAGRTDPNNQLWLMGYTQGDEPGGYVQQWWLRDFKESRGYFQVLLHTTGDASTDEATRQRIIRLVYNTTVHDSWFIEPADDFFTHFEDAKKVTVSGNTLQVNGSTVAGLVLWQPSGTSNVVLNDRTATIVARNHMAMLPALNNGTYTFNYSSSYPKISAYTNGSLINNGYYDIQNSTMYFSIHDDDEIYNRTNVSLTNLSGTTLYLRKDGVNVSSFTPTNGNYTLSNLPEGNYTIRNTSPITPKINWDTPENITSNTPLSNTQLNAVAKDPVTEDIVPGTFVYSPPAGTYLNPGQHVLYATFTPNDTAKYSIANASVTINVNGSLVTNGLVVHYNGDLSPGNLLQDISGNGNTGYATSVTNGTNQSTGANYINLNGVSSKINVSSNNAETNISSPVTIEFIGSINAFSKYGSIVAKYKDKDLQPPGNGWYMACSSTAPYNHIRFGVNLMDGGETSFESNIGLVAGQVYDIVETYDNNTAHIYVNGVDQGSAIWNSPVRGSSETIKIAFGDGINGLNTTSLNGNMYVFRLYNRSLSQSEIVQNYEYDRWRFDPIIQIDNITMIKRLVYGDGGLPRYMGSHAMSQSGAGVSLIDSNMSSVGGVSTPYYQDNGGIQTNYALSSSSISGVKWKDYYASGSSASLSFSGNNRNRLENISLSNNSLDISSSVTYNAKSLVTKDAVPVTGNAFQFYGNGLNTISENTIQAYTDNGVIQNDCILNSTGKAVYTYYQNRTAGTVRSNSVEIPLSSPQLTPMPCPSGYLSSLSFAIHADYQDPDSVKTLVYGTNDTQNPVYGTKGYFGHGLNCTWSAFAASSVGYGFDNALFKSNLDNMSAHGFEIIPHNVDGSTDEDAPTRTTVEYYLPWYHSNYSSRNWIDHGLNGGVRDAGLKSLGLDKNASRYYVGDLMREYNITYAWAYQDVQAEAGLSTSRTQSVGLPYDIIWTNTNFSRDDGTPMYEWSSTWAPDKTSLNYFKNDTLETMINNYGVCFWHDYTAEDDATFENYYYTKGHPNMINQTYDNLLINISEQKAAKKLWNPTVSQYIDYWRAACNVECKCTGQNTYTLVNHNSAAISGYAMRVKGSYTVKLDNNTLNSKMNGAETVFWMDLSPGTHTLTLASA